MLFDWDMPSIVGEFVIFPDYPFVNRPITVPNDTTYIQANAGNTINIQASAGITN